MASQFLLWKSGHVGNPSGWWMAILSSSQGGCDTFPGDEPPGVSGGLVVLWRAGGRGCCVWFSVGSLPLERRGLDQREKETETRASTTPQIPLSLASRTYRVSGSLNVYLLASWFNVFLYCSFRLFFSWSQRQLYSFLKIQKMWKNTEKEIKTLHRLPTPPGDTSQSYCFCISFQPVFYVTFFF